MNESSQREVAVFEEALSLSAAERAAYLERACGGDVALRQRVEALLQSHASLGDFLEQSPRKTAVETGPETAAGEKAGDRIGRYKLLQQIGEGGCGVVFMAEQEEPIRRRVALKVIKPGMDTKNVIARFEAERQALALMDHPNIAKAYDAGATESGRPYFVMELVRGIKITDYCDQHSLTTEERLKLFIQVCQAVQHAHQKGVIHRDIKPSNILVTTTMEGTALPVVIDFGIAKATTNQRLTDKTLFTAFEMLIGTPAYMSPEQAALTSVDVDTRTDIYSLGVLLYELLTGSTPFDAGEILKSGLDEIRRVIREEEPVRPSTRLSKMTDADLTTLAQNRKAEPPTLIRAVRGDLDWIAMKAMEKDRTRRYETANGLALDVQRYLANEPISARPPNPVYKLQKMVLRNKLLFVGLGVIALLLIVSLIAVSTSLAKERHARLEADAALKQAEADRSRSQNDAAKSHQVTKFLEEMLNGVGPSVALGRDTTMLREILDRTAERVGQEMTNQPAVEAELCGLIGQIYLEIGKYDRAEQMQRAALAINRKLFSSESKQAAASLNDLGLALSRQGNLPAAEAEFQEALRIRRRIFGDENADVATTLNNMATVLRHAQRLAESEALTREALGIRRKIFGNENLEVADSLHNLSIVLGDEGHGAESEMTARELLAVRRKLLGAENILVASALNDVSWAAGLNGKLDEAESLQREALAIQRKLLGDENPAVAATLSSLGERIRQRGNLAESDAVLNAALIIQSKVVGENSPDYLYTLDKFGSVLDGEGKWAEAESVYRKALAAWSKLAGKDSPRALADLGGVVRALIGQKKTSDAEQMLNETLTPEFAKEPSSGDLLALRAGVYARRGQWQEAATDAALAFKNQPLNKRYSMVAALFIKSNNRPAYYQFCEKLLTEFSNTTDIYVADQVAKSCLFLPSSQVDLKVIDRLVDVALAHGTGDAGAMPYFQDCKALIEYRMGHYAEAVEWAQKPLQIPEFARRLLAGGIKSFCAVPLMIENRRIGVFGLASTEPEAFRSFNVEFLQRGTAGTTKATENQNGLRSSTKSNAASREEDRYLKSEISPEDNFEGIIGRSQTMHDLRKGIEVVAPTGSTVLILGETGTGKERIAQAIHNLSSRRDRPFIKVNCAAIPAGLIESELFGHERGSFTGAIGRRIGRFEMAHGGTLFLDEIGDIPLELQPKLLRVLQEQEFERLGGTQTTRVDVRVVAATSRDLPRMVEAKEFRCDLYYRLNVFPLRVPPLRERSDDIALLVRHFVDLYAKRMCKQVKDVPLQAMETLMRYSWPGNVRELQNIIERAVILSPGKVLHLPLDELKQSAPVIEAAKHTPNGELTTFQDAAREHIIQALAATNWVLGGPKGASARLGLARTTLIGKMQKLGISRVQA